MAKIITTFSYKTGFAGFSANVSADAYTLDNGETWHWVSNDAVCPMDACIRYSIPCNPAKQEAARDAEVQAFCEQYHKRMENHVPTPEEQFEQQAAFGKGVKLVNVITGKSHTT